VRYNASTWKSAGANVGVEFGVGEKGIVFEGMGGADRGEVKA
jgi:hypothetical protein